MFVETNARWLPRRGERVCIRQLRIDDLSPFQRYRSDPEVGRFQGWTPMTDSEAIAFLREVSEVRAFERGEWSQIAIARNADDALIGDIGIHLSEQGESAELGISLAADSQRLGLATEAGALAIELVYDTTPAQRIFAITDARNEASIQLWSRLGMTFVREQQVEFRGERCTEHVFVKVRDARQESAA